MIQLSVTINGRDPSNTIQNISHNIQYGGEFTKKVSRKELHKFAMEARTIAKNHAPVWTGYLRKHIKIRTKKDKDGSTINLISEAPYSAAIELGSRPHYVSTESPTGIGDLTVGNWVLDKTVGTKFNEYPSTIFVSGKAQPFMIHASNYIRRNLTSKAKKIAKKVVQGYKGIDERKMSFQDVISDPFGSMGMETGGEE